tara:strand:+ start:194 stop:544 length:351 start_codon:yes stop_codon:yes gene_type:complete
MKSLFSFSLIVFLIFKAFLFKVNAAEIESIQDTKQRITTEKIAEKFCSAKVDHFFEGLDNEKTLKYSYFKYIGIHGKEMFSKDMYEPLINQINKKCLISKEEERELNEFFFKVYED